MFRIQEYIKRSCNDNIKQLSPHELEKLQNHLFSMYKDIESICKRHKLNMVMCGGNALGAARHNGWIPWDDDLDIAMPRKDYDLFLNEYFKELPDKYVVYSLFNSKGPIVRFSKVIDTTTKFSSIADCSPKHIEGVFIDIFPYDNVANSKYIHKIKQIIAFGLMFIQNSVNQKVNGTDEYKSILCSTSEGKKAYQLRQFIGSIFNFLPLNKWYRLLDKVIQNNNNSEFIYCGVNSSTAWRPMPRHYMFPGKLFTYPNGETAIIPNEPENYLSHIFGDWKKIPEDKDKWHHYVKDFKLPSISQLTDESN